LGLKEDLQSEVTSIFATEWSRRNGQLVPAAESVRLGNDAIEFAEAVVLYADLADSTQLVQGYKDWFAAEVYKTYLRCASRIISDNNGEVTAFDGDRVMAVFIGDYKRTNAAKTALKINHAVTKIINPSIKSKFPTATYQIQHAVGVDVSKLMIARTGVRGSNDLVWVGRAANYAAKLCSVREGSYSSLITAEVYDQMNEEGKVGGNPKRSMWEKRRWTDRNIDIYISNWEWMP
jgi:class 3 adenylate cyclase